MSGSGWQSSDLLTKFNQYTGRNASGDTITDATKYQYLADAQQEVIGQMVAIAPKPFLTAPFDISTNTTDNKVFTFGVDGDGYPAFPMNCRIYPTLSAIPDWPLIPGVDYLDEGTQIRMPNNLTLLYPALYVYGVFVPQEMSASVQPVLQPPPARILIVLKAAVNFAMTNLAADAQSAGYLDNKYTTNFNQWMTTIRKHFRGGGALRPLVSPLLSSSPGTGFGAGNVLW